MRGRLFNIVNRCSVPDMAPRCRKWRDDDDGEYFALERDERDGYRADAHQQA
jgi:hypothetical protein